MIAFDNSKAVSLSDRSYFDFVISSVESARRRVWVSTFIYDLRPARDLEGQVLDLTLALAARRRVGVDTRVLLTGPVDTPDIAVANLASGLLLEQYGVPTRRTVGHGQRAGSHAKFVVFDDCVVVGSQNWTDDAFRLNIEDALVLTGDALGPLEEEFVRLWGAGRGMPRHAA